MNTNVSIDDVRNIASVRDEVCLSLYMPVRTPSVKNPQSHENMIQLKTLERRAHQKLAEWMDAPEALLGPLRESLKRERPLWAPKAHGFACFLSPEFSRWVSLPIEVAERVVVDSEFYILPLVQALSNAAGFYVLSLDQRRVRLFQGDWLSLHPIEPEEPLPTMPELLAEYDFERNLNVAPGTSAQVQFGPERDIKSRLMQFLERLDDAVVREIGPNPLPVVLAGVDYIVGHYRKLTRIRTLADEFIRGNPSRLSADQLHATARQIVRNEKQADMDVALRRLDRTSEDQRIRGVENVLPAAYEGRVQALYICPDRTVCGRFDPVSETVEVSDGARGSETTDLLDLAARLTTRSGGDVFCVDEEEAAAIAGEHPAIALHR